MKKRILLKAEKNPRNKPEKSSRSRLFCLKFGMSDGLHNVMHGEDGINGMENRCSSANS